jgi:GTP pyrophosphokinase
MVSTTNSLSIHRRGNSQYDIKTWLKSIARSDVEEQAILNACTWAEEVHESQIHISGEPFLLHPVRVCDILAQLGMDTNVLVAAILHEVLLEQQILHNDIQNRFGKEVTALVDGVAKMEIIETINEKNVINSEKQVESLRKMLLAMAEDVRVVLIKLADRLDNMRALRYHSEKTQRRVARETLDLFAPLANRLGIWQIKWELEDLSLRYLEPETYKNLAKFLDERRIDRENYIQKIIHKVSKALEDMGIKAELSGRPKHIYSIWRKMQRKNLDFNEIFDVLAVRVLVNTREECYATLGIVHSQWQPLEKEFDDYIANPKNNNYQSLHTAVIGPEQKIFEVQIRTHQMHQDAELGVASHWRYKEAGTQQDKVFENKIAWLRQILHWKEEDGDINDLIDRFKSEIFEDRVYVLSPQGHVIDLPQGATPLDFAYHIHTEIGHRCRGAKINHRLVPLTYTLKSGEMVEILTAKEAKPSRDWLIPQAGYLKTSKARNKLRHWLRKQEFPQNITDGRELLERLLRQLNFQECNLDELAHSMNFKSQDQFLASIGRGDTTAWQITHFFNEKFLTQKTQPAKKVPKPHQQQGSVQIGGVAGLLTNIARCCNPVPYDPIVGYITKGRGVMIHRSDCPNAMRWENEANERLIKVEWKQPESVEDFHAVEVYINCFDRKGLLRDIYTILADDKINILSSNTSTNQSDNSVNMKLIFQVNNLQQLSRALGKIDHLPNVMKVWRES